MHKSTFRFIAEKDLDGIPIIAVLSESEIQSFAESNFGRELSDLELNRIRWDFWDNGKVVDLIDQAIRLLINTALNEKDIDWERTDKIYYVRSSTNK